jgi:nucleotide-binding universal stress UspA family protein
MIERVVVPIDFSPESERAIPTAAALARAANAAFELITVAEPLNRDEAQLELSRVARDSASGAEVRVIESGGPAEAALLADLHRTERSLWCVGTHARGAVGELVFGSVSEELVRDSHVPVLLVGPHAGEPQTGKVLAVAVDGTPESEAIITVADELANDVGMTVRLLQVIEPSAPTGARDSFETAHLARLSARYFSGRDVDYDVLHGKDVVKALTEYASLQPEVGMIALATRGLTGGARLLHGSTAFELAHDASDPVLVLHPAEPTA